MGKQERKFNEVLPPIRVSDEFVEILDLACTEIEESKSVFIRTAVEERVLRLAKKNENLQPVVEKLLAA